MSSSSEATRPRRRRRVGWLRRIVRVVAYGLCAALLVRTFGSVDAHATLRAVLAAGPGLLVVLAPFGAILVLDAFASTLLARAMGIDIGTFAMCSVRVVSEAVHVSAPGGAIAGDAATATLLADRAGLAAPDAGLVTVARKWLVTRTHAFYIVGGALLGASTLRALGTSLRIAHLPALVIASAALPLGLSLVLGASLRPHTLAWLRRIAGRISRRRRWAPSAAAAARVAATHGRLVRLARARSLTATAGGFMLACWLLESLETAVLARLLGIPIELAAVVGLECGLSVARTASSLAPGGLGVQDVGYATALGALGASPESAAAFVVLKRCRDLVWALVGYALGLLAPRGLKDRSSCERVRATYIARMSIPLADAARLLVERLGGHVEAAYVPGKSLFRDALCEGMGISQVEAEVLCDSLEQQHILRFTRTPTEGPQWVLVLPAPFADA